MATLPRLQANRSAMLSLLAGGLLLLPAFGFGCAGDAHASEAPAPAIEPAPERTPVCARVEPQGGEPATAGGSVLVIGPIEIPEDALPEGAVEVALLPADATPEEIAAPCD